MSPCGIENLVPLGAPTGQLFSCVAQHEREKLAEKKKLLEGFPSSTASAAGTGPRRVALLSSVCVSCSSSPTMLRFFAWPRPFLRDQNKSKKKSERRQSVAAKRTPETEEPSDTPKQNKRKKSAEREPRALGENAKEKGTAEEGRNCRRVDLAPPPTPLLFPPSPPRHSLSRLFPLSLRSATRKRRAS